MTTLWVLLIPTSMDVRLPIDLLRSSTATLVIVAMLAPLVRAIDVSSTNSVVRHKFVHRKSPFGRQAKESKGLRGRVRHNCSNYYLLQIVVVKIGKLVIGSPVLLATLNSRERSVGQTPAYGRRTA